MFYIILEYELLELTVCFLQQCALVSGHTSFSPLLSILEVIGCELLSGTIQILGRSGNISFTLVLIAI